MSDPVQIDHAQAIIDLLPGQLQNKTNWPKLLTAVAAPFNELEQVFMDLRSKRSIDASEGAQVDGLGDIVGEKRQGDGDAAYLIRIAARILLNRSSATPEDIYKIFSVLTNGANTFVMREAYPASLTLEVHEALTLDATRMAAVLKLAKAGGVGALFVWSVRPLSQTFRFDSGPGFDLGHFAGGIRP